MVTGSGSEDHQTERGSFRERLLQLEAAIPGAATGAHHAAPRHLDRVVDRRVERRLGGAVVGAVDAHVGQVPKRLRGGASSTAQHE